MHMVLKRGAALLLAVSLLATPAAAAETTPALEAENAHHSLESRPPAESNVEEGPSGLEEPAASTDPFVSEEAPALHVPPQTSSEEGGFNICENVGDLLETVEHKAYVQGYADETFLPSGQITRAEAAQLFYNLLLTQPEITQSFVDVPETAWYASPVLSLASLGVLQGYGDGNFRPAGKITRAEFVTIAARFASLKSGTVQFSDIKENHWAYPYIRSACGYGWISGYEDQTFRPAGNITRAEAVKILNAMLGRKADPHVEKIYYTVEFYDVPPTHWAFPLVCEAATEHSYHWENQLELWDLPNRYDGTGWALSEGLIRYRNEKTGDFLYGFQPIGGYVYYLDEVTGELQTGWQVIDGQHHLLPNMDQSLQTPTVNELLTETNYTPSNRTFGDIEYITVHYTAVPGDTAQDECGYFQKEYRGTSANYFVDESGIWRCVRDKDIAWHCGNDIYYHDACRNYNSIGIEMCSQKVDTSGRRSAYDLDWYFLEETLENTARLVREMMLKYGVPLENVVRHNDVSHKTCPAPFTNDFSQWQDFLQRICEGQLDYEGGYPARTTPKELNVRSGPSTSYGILRVLEKDTPITVLRETGTDGDKEGRWVELQEGGWVSYPYICRLGENLPFTFTPDLSPEDSPLPS